MSDILIRGMEMPKDWDLWLCIDTGGTVYNVKPVITGTAQEVGTAILLPEGHGRLIDGDAPLKMVYSDGTVVETSVSKLFKEHEDLGLPIKLEKPKIIIDADKEWQMKNCCCMPNEAEDNGS